MEDLPYWIGFFFLIAFLLFMDLGVFHKKPHIVTLKESLVWSAIWVIMAVIFLTSMWYWRQTNDAIEFTTGYLVEKSLSVDNLFVFVLIFSAWKIPPMYQHRVLFWGIIGALTMRCIFIVCGVELIKEFHWFLYIFGAILLYTACRILYSKEEPQDYYNHPILKFIQKFVPIVKEIDSDRFFIKKDNRWHATPLFVVLVLIEISDQMFAIDSIPAVLSVTDDSFILYASNVFAVFGLRMLYFSLSHILKYFAHIKYGLAVILGFVGLKMLLNDFYKISSFTSLGVIGSILLVTILSSSIWKPKEGSTLSL